MKLCLRYVWVWFILYYIPSVFIIDKNHCFFLPLDCNYRHRMFKYREDDYMRGINWGKGLSVFKNFTPSPMEDQGKEGRILSGLDHDTSFLFKDSACREHHLTGTPCTNLDEIFNWMSQQNFPAMLNKLHQHSFSFLSLLSLAQFVLTALKPTILQTLKKCNSAEDFFSLMFRVISLWKPQIWWQLWGVTISSIKVSPILW